MTMIPRLLFVLALVLAPVIVWSTTLGLPERVATHFGRGGMPNGWMPRDGYLAFMLAMSTVLPLFVVATTGLLPRLAPSLSKIRNREHWFAPARREATLDWLLNHASWLGVVLCTFLVAVHLLIVQANAQVPVRLAEPPLLTAVVGFLIALAIWIATMIARFRRLG